MKELLGGEATDRTYTELRQRGFFKEDISLIRPGDPVR